jgi:hypothetical protein
MQDVRARPAVDEIKFTLFVIVFVDVGGKA